MIRARLLVVLSSMLLALGLMAPAAVAQPAGGLLQNVQVTGQTQDGRDFTGTLDITNITRDGDQLLVDGVLNGVLDDGTPLVDALFEDVTADPDGDSCPILNLQLGPLDLDLLGLVIELDQVNLDITAERGPGRLLGNLLCAVAGLLDGGGPLSSIGNAIDNLLNRINNLLG